MVCPKCNSTDLKNVSLIYAAGSYKSEGHFHGGSLDTFFLGRYRGTYQSQLSRMVAPPGKAPYGTPVILWVIGVFVVVPLLGRGKFPNLRAMLIVAYWLLLPAYLLAATVYNLLLRPRRVREWKRRYLCQRCGAIAVGD